MLSVGKTPNVTTITLSPTITFTSFSAIMAANFSGINNAGYVYQIASGARGDVFEIADHQFIANTRQQGDEFLSPPPEVIEDNDRRKRGQKREFVPVYYLGADAGGVLAISDEERRRIIDAAVARLCRPKGISEKISAALLKDISLTLEKLRELLNEVMAKPEDVQILDVVNLDMLASRRPEFVRPIIEALFAIIPARSIATVHLLGLATRHPEHAGQIISKLVEVSVGEHSIINFMRAHAMNEPVLVSLIVPALIETADRGPPGSVLQLEKDARRWPQYAPVIVMRLAVLSSVNPFAALAMLDLQDIFINLAGADHVANLKIALAKPVGDIDKLDVKAMQEEGEYSPLSELSYSLQIAKGAVAVLRELAKKREDLVPAIIDALESVIDKDKVVKLGETLGQVFGGGKIDEDVLVSAKREIVMSIKDVFGTAILTLGDIAELFPDKAHQCIAAILKMTGYSPANLCAVWPRLGPKIMRYALELGVALGVNTHDGDEGEFDKFGLN